MHGSHLLHPCFCELQAANVTESMSKAMIQIASTLTPTPSGSKAKIIDRSKCYKQLGELRDMN